jgi:NAD(P)-dependent dehydrogenase (short-subunit alcohol dehydrogenase family)
MSELSGRVALVTGASGGYGSAIARRLARAGADVAIADLDVESDAARAIQAEVRGLGVRVTAISVDVTSDADCARMAQAAIDELGGIDILVANAGLGGDAALSWELSEANWDRVVGVCLKGVWLTTRHVIPHMIERGSGRIVMTSSRNGLRAERWCSHYVAAKHGVIGLMKALALELGPYRINVNAVCPTSMGRFETWHPWWDLVTGRAGTTADEFNAWGGRQDLFEKDERMTFDAAAEGAYWLVTDGAATVTGHALPVDDGWIAKRGG